MTQEYVQMLRDSLQRISEEIHHGDKPCRGQHRSPESLAIELEERQEIARAALAAPITPAPLRPMSEAPVNTQLLKALEYMEQNLVKYHYSGHCIHCGGVPQCKPSYPMFHLKTAIKAAKEIK